jgi:hypothetical protein
VQAEMIALDQVAGCFPLQEFQRSFPSTISTRIGLPWLTYPTICQVAGNFWKGNSDNTDTTSERKRF